MSHEGKSIVLEAEQGDVIFQPKLGNQPSEGRTLRALPQNDQTGGAPSPHLRESADQSRKVFLPGEPADTEHDRRLVRVEPRMGGNLGSTLGESGGDDR